MNSTIVYIYTLFLHKNSDFRLIILAFFFQNWASNFKGVSFLGCAWKFPNSIVNRSAQKCFGIKVLKTTNFSVFLCMNVFSVFYVWISMLSWIWASEHSLGILNFSTKFSENILTKYNLKKELGCVSLILLYKAKFIIWKIHHMQNSLHEKFIIWKIHQMKNSS